MMPVTCSDRRSLGRQPDVGRHGRWRCQGCDRVTVGGATVSCETGTGKTHRLIAFGVAASEQGCAVGCITAAQLVNEAFEAADDRQLSRTVARYRRLDLLLLDELGHIQLDSHGAELVFQVLTDPEERAPPVTSTFSTMAGVWLFGLVATPSAAVWLRTNLERCEERNRQAATDPDG
ncbi:MAG: ATP-binding protein [Actinobacteria bacterium]|nr:ATP-binding protein [Actinomycetota bacterium]